MGKPDDREDVERKSEDLPVMIAYRLNQAEKKLQNLDDKLTKLSEGFVQIKVELEHVAKNEGKTSGAISGVITGVIIAVLGVAFQILFKAD